jgi:N-acetylglucosaminyldiphosphoundecaprenol N-acetyl-beta-D-mannosaminyltransferase
MRDLLKAVTDKPLSIDYKDGKKILINTANAHTFNLIKADPDFLDVMLKSDLILPDGVGTVIAERLILKKRIKKIAGFDLFTYEMDHLNKFGGKCFFLGSTEKVLEIIRQRATTEYPNVKISTYSPPYKPVFSDNDNDSMIEAVNSFSPDVLFVGMTQPKQERWAVQNIEKLNVRHVCSIGAVFDFYAGTVKRAPSWMINLGLEWFYRLVREPKRMWKRYVTGNFKFFMNLIREMIK